MKELTHQRIDIKSEKVLNITLKDKRLISETGKKEKLKTTEKEFSDAEDALKNFYEREWDALKKDFVLANQNAETGQRRLII